MTPEQRYLLERTEVRAEAVRRYAQLCLDSNDGTFIPTVAAFMAWNLIRTLFLLCGEALRTTSSNWLFGKLLDEAAFCTLCHKFKDSPNATACRECLDAMDREDAEATKLLQFEEPPKGGIS